jgi:hypothetical protein
MPVSKSKRKKRGGRRRPPSVQTHAKPKKTSRWVVPVFFTLLGLGVLIIIGNYFADAIFGPGSFKTYLLFVGLGLMGASFAVATRLR